MPPNIKKIVRPDCEICGREAGAGDEIDNADHVAATVLAHQLLTALRPLRPRRQDVAAQPPRQHDKGGGGRQAERPSTLQGVEIFFFNEEI
jgi:hypothetical protein